MGQSHARPFFLHCAGSGGEVVDCVVSWTRSEFSASEAAAVVSDCFLRSVTERVIVLTVSAK